MPPASRWISTTLLSLSAVPLGRLVADISDPEDEFQDTSRSTELPSNPEVVASETRKEDFTHYAASPRSWGLTVALTAVLGSMLSIQKDDVISVVADACTTRRLSNSASYFDQACQSDTVREWLEQRWRERRKAYIAVGIMTVSNARINLRQSREWDVGQKVAIPGSTVLLAATQGAVPTLGGLENVLDSEISVSRGGGEQKASSFSVPGESILAVQYRQVNFSWFRKPSSNPIGLKAAAWEAYLGSRGADSEDEDENENEESTEKSDNDNNDDLDFVTLQAEAIGDVGADDLGEFDHHKSFALNDSEEVWHIF